MKMARYSRAWVSCATALAQETTVCSLEQWLTVYHDLADAGKKGTIDTADYWICLSTQATNTGCDAGSIGKAN